MASTMTELQKINRNYQAIRETLCVNPGNRFTEFINPKGQIIRLPSVVRDFDLSFEDYPQHNDSTVVIERGDRVYAVGSLAKSLKGKAAFDKGKIAMMADLVFAALEPNQGMDILRIENLMIAVPDARNDEAIKAVKSLEGTHDYKRNGKDLIVTIAKATAIEETAAAYRYGIRNGLYQWTGAINGVIDFGGGTSSGRLYAPDGTPIREASITLPGTNALGHSIQARLLKATGQSAGIGSILDGIENGTYTTGCNGVSFAAHFDGCVEEWLDNIRSTARGQWAAYFADLGEVLLVGGSAPLATEIERSTSGRFKIAENPQDITIKGMSL
ncbi:MULTISPECIES: ParM/StbA family protein [Leptolyngbya]|uniref:ParM/StbA family protein n=1 Tax=Leptolyngbya TaxID=47251 RepID=UPI00168A1D5C|nr:ParM/StbA family protein [Leptolyngbya sp. FACHB-1624]MBD1856581.1 ParM/StbA family protein [Leptolyngbya sp. FACHB-1624]